MSNSPSSLRIHQILKLRLLSLGSLKHKVVLDLGEIWEITALSHTLRKPGDPIEEWTVLADIKSTADDSNVQNTYECFAHKTSAKTSAKNADFLF